MKAVAFLFATVALLTGANYPIEGKWLGTQTQGSQTMKLNISFTAPNKMAASMNLPGNMGKMNVVGTYKLKGDILTVITKDVSLVTSGPNGEQMKKMFDANKAQTLKEMNKDTDSKVKWLSRDKCKLSSTKTKDVLTLTRVK